MENNSLQHYGVLGMKWGRRLYQAKDGTLTAAGKKRYNKAMEKLKNKETVLKNKQKTQAKIDKLDAKHKQLKEMKKELSGKKDKNTLDSKNDVKAEAAKKTTRSVKDIPTDELNTIVNRLNLEQRYTQLTPEKKSLGKRFLESTFNDVILPVAKDQGKKILKDMLDQKDKK